MRSTVNADINANDLELTDLLLDWCRSKGIRIFFQLEPNPKKEGEFIYPLYTVDPDDDQILTPMICDIIWLLKDTLQHIFRKDELNAIKAARRHTQPRK